MQRIGLVVRRVLVDGQRSNVSAAVASTTPWLNSCCSTYERCMRPSIPLLLSVCLSACGSPFVGAWEGSTAFVSGSGQITELVTRFVFEASGTEGLAWVAGGCTFALEPKGDVATLASAPDSCALKEGDAIFFYTDAAGAHAQANDVLEMKSPRASRSSAKSNSTAAPTSSRTVRSASSRASTRASGRPTATLAQR